MYDEKLGVFFLQAEDGIRDRVRSRGLGDVYKRQITRNTSESNNLVSNGLDLEAGDEVLVHGDNHQRLYLIHI